MYKRLIYFFVFTGIFFQACNYNSQAVSGEDGLAAFSADSMKLHVSILASDSFMGRKPFTEGETKTIHYL